MTNDNPLLGLDLFEDEKPIKKGNENVNPLLGLDLFEETPKKKETPELEVSSNDAQEPLENGLSNGEQANQYDISKLSDEDFSLSELTAPSKETTHYDLPKLAELQEKADNQPIYKIEDGQKSVYEKLDLHEGETDLDKLRSRGDFYAPTYVENYLKNPVDKELYDIEKDIEYAKSFAEKGKDGKYSELAEKEISSLEKKKYEVLKKRHRAIDESIYQLKNEIENGVYEEDGNPRTVNMWGSGQVPVQDKRLRKLTEEEIEERKSQIKKLERQKGLFFNEEESAKEVILDNEDEVKELIYKGLMPKGATLQDAAKILLQYKDELLKKAQDDEGYNKKGIVGKIERGVDFVINNVLGADKREEEIKKLQEDLRTIAPVALLNRSNINNKQTVLDVLGKEVFKGVVPMASPLALTNKDIVEATARSFDEIGVDVGSKDVSKFYGDVMESVLNKGGSFTGQGAAEATGQTVGFLLPFMLGSGIFNAALRTSKYGRGIKALAETGRLGKEGSRLLHRLSSRSKGINRILYQGFVGGGEFATTGLISDKDEEAFFEAGLIGGMGGGAFETAINAMFGNKAKPAISLLSRYFGKAAGEVVQEFGEGTAGNLKTIDENGNVGRALLDLARDSDKWNEFKAEYKKQFPNLKETSWFVLQTMLMGAVFNASELGGLFTKEAESELKKLPESEQRDIRSAFEKLNGESRQIVQSELDGVLNPDGTIKEEEKGKTIDERELSDEVENLGIEEDARIELSQDKKEVEELNENAASFNAEETTLEDEVSKELQSEVDSVLNPKEESKSETKEEQPIEEVVEESSEKQEGKVEEKGKIVTKSTDGISLEQYAEGQEDETKSEDLLVNGEQVEPNYILKEGDVISKNTTKEQEQDNSSGVSESVEAEPTVSEGSEQPTEETQEVSEEQAAEQGVDVVEDAEVEESKPIESTEIKKEEEKQKEEDFNEYPIGVTNAYTEASRQARGADPLLKAEKQSNKKLWESVDKKIETGEIDPREEVKKIASEDNPSVSDEKQAVLLHDRVRITNERNLLKQQLEDARDNGDAETEMSILSRLAELEVEQEINDVANTKLGASWGKSGQIRQRMANEDYSLANIIRDARALNNGESLSASQEAKFEKLSKKLEELQKQNTVLQEQIAAKEKEFAEKEEAMRQEQEQKLIDAIAKEIEKRSAEKPKKGKNVKEKGKDLAAKIRAGKIKNQKNKFTFSTIVPPPIIDGAIEVVALSVEAGSTIAHAINEGIKKVKQSDWYKNLNSDEQKRFEVKFAEYINSNTKDEKSSKEKFQEKVEKNDGVFDSSFKNIINQMVYEAVESGATNINEVVDIIHEFVSSEIDGVTKREVRDIISGYGEFRKLSKEEIDVKVRELKRQGRLDSALEDVANDQLPLRSGVERDKKTDETRRKEAELLAEIKRKDLTPPPSQAQIDSQWKSAQEAYHRRLENAISDVQNEIDTGVRRAKKKGKKFDDERSKELRAELERLKKLRDEAFKLPPKTPLQKRTDAIISATKRAIAELQSDIDKIKNGEETNKEVSVSGKAGKKIFGLRKPKKEPIQNQEVENLRNLRDSLKEQLSELLPDNIKDKALLEKYKAQRKRRLEQLLEQQRNKDYGEKPKPQKPPLDKETRDINREILRVKDEIEKEKEKIRLANRGKVEIAADMALDFWNLSKALMASVDLSAPLRQGVVFLGKPKIFAKAFRDMFRHAFSKKMHENWLLDLKETDVYYEMIDNGLYIAEPTAKLSAKEEAFMSNFLKYFHKIPIYGQMLAGSERAYTGFLNKLRVDAYMNFRGQLEKEGFSEEEMKKELEGYSHFINVSTGRGKLGVFEGVAPVLNGAFFSPRLISSRLSMLYPPFYAKLPKEARKDALKTFAGFLATGIVTLTLYNIMADDDDKVELDPRSTDFGKIKVGNKRYDIWGGYQQVVKTMAQALSGQRKSSTTDEISNLSKDKFPHKTRLGVVWDFFKYKLSPSAALAYGLLDDKTNAIGEEITLEKATIERAFPLYLQDMYEIIEEEGVGSGLVSSIPPLFGVGIQYYGTEKSEEKYKENKEVRKIRNLKRDIRLNKSQYKKTGDSKYREEYQKMEKKLKELERNM